MLIGITGKIGSGKTTAANYLVSSCGFTEYTMAEPIKQIGTVFGFTHNQLYGTQKEKLEIHPHWGVSGREFLQKIGTDMFRDLLPQVIPNMKISKSVWCDIFRLKYNGQAPTVVSDIRFADEAQTIRDLGGVIIRIVRDEGYACSEHISETGQSEITHDFLINNNSDTKSLYSSIDSILQSQLGYCSRDTEYTSQGQSQLDQSRDL
jgi:hypothetical protein